MTAHMAVKYIICPGWVRSRSDGQLHFINASQLFDLYDVDPRECIVVYYEIGPENSGLRGYSNEFLEGLQLLYPKQNGDYSL